MKRIFTVLSVLLTLACNREPAAWEEPKVEIPVVTRGASETGFAPLNYQLFVYDREKKQTSLHRIPAGTNGNFNLKLAPGSYTGYCFVNAESAEVWEYRAADNPSDIYLILSSEEERYVEAGDYLSGKQDFTVQTSESPAVVFDLQRRVAALRLIVEEVPDWVEGLRLHVKGVPGKMSLEGEYQPASGTVAKEVPLPGSGMAAETRMLLFPSADPIELSLCYRIGGIKYETAPYLLDSLPVNRITELNALFGASGGISVDFQATVTAWDEEVIRGEDWLIDVEVCTGNGDGINLLVNGGFEAGEAAGIPTGWKLDSDGVSKQVSIVSDPVQEGAYAVKLAGKTYLYQDIAVEGGGCYQFRLRVNAPVPQGRWRYWYTWMKGSTALTASSEEIRSDYRTETAGYAEVWNSRVVKAPAEADKLRVEIRTYLTDDLSGGIFVDDVGVERVTGNSR